MDSAHPAASAPLCEPFFCQFCLEDHPGSFDSVVLPCGHRFDETCLVAWVSAGVVEGRSEFACQFNFADPQAPAPHAEGICNAAVPHDIVEGLLRRSVDTLAKYRRFRRVAADPNLRPCPFCDELVAGGSPAAPALTCPSCSRGFCFLHANAHPSHPPETCAAYEATSAAGAEARATDAALADSTRACPGCGIRVSKAGGCNSMKCSACKTSFCWLCGKTVSRGHSLRVPWFPRPVPRPHPQIDDSELPMHYAFWNLAGCTNQQMSDAPSRGGAARCCNTATSLVATVLLGPPSLAIACACTVVCLPCCFQSLRRGVGRHMALATQARVFGGRGGRGVGGWNVGALFSPRSAGSVDCAPRAARAVHRGSSRCPHRALLPAVYLAANAPGEAAAAAATAAAAVSCRRPGPCNGRGSGSVSKSPAGVPLRFYEWGPLDKGGPGVVVMWPASESATH